MIKAIKSFFARREQARRRAKYDFLKAKIVERHFAGFAGLTVDFKEHKFDRVDMLSFKPPMYGTVQNMKGQWCIFWQQKMMIQEVGVGAPLREGEVLETAEEKRIGFTSHPDLVDQQKPLTRQVEKAPDESEPA